MSRDDPDALQGQLDAAIAAGAPAEEILDLRTGLAASLLAHGEAEAAVEQLELATRTRMVRDGIDDPETLDVLGMLGRALTDARRYAEAESVLTDVVRGRTEVLGADDPQTLVARGNLLRAVGRGGRPDEALELVDALLADRERLLGRDHPSTLDTRGHRAQLLGDAGQSERAAVEMQRLLDDRLRLLGPAHPDVISTRHNLAAVRSRSALVDPVDALWELEQNAMALEADLGPEHPATLIALGMVAEQAQRLGRHDDAVALLDRVIATRTGVLGANGGATLTSRRMRCESLRHLGHVKEAADAATQLDLDTTAVFGPGADETLRSRLELVDCLQALVDSTDGADPSAVGRLEDAARRVAAADVSGSEPADAMRQRVEAIRAAMDLR